MDHYNAAKSSESWRRGFKTVWRARLWGRKMERPLKVAKITGWKIPSKIILLFHFMLMFNSTVLDNKCLFFQSHLKINGVFTRWSTAFHNVGLFLVYCFFQHLYISIPTCFHVCDSDIQNFCGSTNLKAIELRVVK